MPRIDEDSRLKVQGDLFASKPLVQQTTQKKKQELTGNQLKCLKVLSEADGYLTRARIAELMGMSDPANLCEFLAHDPKTVARSEKTMGGRKPFPVLGYVEVEELDIEGKEEVVYRITKLGRETLTRLEHLLPPS